MSKKSLQIKSEESDVLINNGQVFKNLGKQSNQINNALLITSKTGLLGKYILPSKISKKKINNKYQIGIEQKFIDPINYPHEWSALMFKEIALAQLKICKTLINFGWCLKDAHPWNFIFDGSKPWFVDMGSIIPYKHLKEEKFIKNLNINTKFSFVYNSDKQAFYKVYHHMMLPYFVLPLYLFELKQADKARQLLLERALNTSKTKIKTKDIFPHFGYKRLKFEIFEYLKKLLLFLPKGERQFLRLLEFQVNQLDTGKNKSNYSDYYKQKRENFSFYKNNKWGPKQLAVYQIIKKYKPKEILDIGGNTGWFSILALKNGVKKAICTDIDEGSINKLFSLIKVKKYNLLPLIYNCLTPNNNIYSRFGDEKIVMLDSYSRLQSDMVIALALIHHLTLGQGKSLKEVLEILQKLTKKYLVIEFVDKTDPLIVNDPGFFKSFQNNPEKFSKYNLETCKKNLSINFKKIVVYDSHPKTRKIILCIKA